MWLRADSGSDLRELGGRTRKISTSQIAKSALQMDHTGTGTLAMIYGLLVEVPVSTV